MLIGLCIVVFLLFVLYEGFKIFRVKLMNMYVRKEREFGKEDVVYIIKC